MLGDVVESRVITDRKGFRDKIQSAITTVNKAYADEIYADFTTLRGIDEVGGVLSGISNLYKIIKTVNNQVHPQKVRFTVSIGDIDLQSSTRDVAEMDGSAFHMADMMLHRIEDDGLFFDMKFSDERVDQLIANQINLLYLLQETWTEKQRRALTAYEETGTQAAAAEVLDVTQQTLSQRLQAIQWKQVLLIENNLNSSLEAYSAELEHVIQY